MEYNAFDSSQEDPNKPQNAWQPTNGGIVQQNGAAWANAQNTNGIQVPQNPNTTQLTPPTPDQQPTTRTYNSDNWNVDGYAKPNYIAENYGNAMAGWDQTKWANADHQTPKYVVGRILAESGAPNRENLARAAERIAEAYPGSTFNGKDKVTIHGVGTIDLLTNSGSGQNMQWAWQTEDGAGAPVMSGANLQQQLVTPNVAQATATPDAGSPLGELNASSNMTVAAPDTGTKAQPDGVTANNRTILADAYKQAWGSDATAEQLDWFETQDPTAMLAHIRGSAPQKAQPDGITPTADTPTATGLPTGASYMEGQDPNNPNALVRMPDGSVIPKSHPLFQQKANPTTATPTGTTGDPADPNAELSNKDAFMKLLRERMSQGDEIDPNDPIIKNQVDQYSAQQNRARNTYLDEQAERNSAHGMGDSGLMDIERRMSAESAGNAVGGFQAELMGRELTARRDEIQHALDSMGRELNDDERQLLERELAAADNAMKKYGIDTQNSQYFAGLSQADKHFLQQMAQSGKYADLDNEFRWAQLGQGDSQFRDQMGFNYADRNAYWDSVRRGQS
jgi:hypothetical protein